jgi:hypothetical protein
MAQQAWEYLLATVTTGAPVIQTYEWNENMKEVRQSNQKFSRSADNPLYYHIEMLAKLGQEGWEYVGVYENLHLFKRLA